MVQRPTERDKAHCRRAGKLIPLKLPARRPMSIAEGGAALANVHKNGVILKLDDISLAKKLWSSIIVLLLAMLATGVWTRHAVSSAHREAAERARNADELIKLTVYWKALTGSNTNLTLASTV